MPKATAGTYVVQSRDLDRRLAPYGRKPAYGLLAVGHEFAEAFDLPGEAGCHSRALGLDLIELHAAPFQPLTRSRALPLHLVPVFVILGQIGEQPVIALDPVPYPLDAMLREPDLAVDRFEPSIARALDVSHAGIGLPKDAIPPRTLRAFGLGRLLPRPCGGIFLLLCLIGAGASGRLGRRRVGIVDLPLLIEPTMEFAGTSRGSPHEQKRQKYSRRAGSRRSLRHCHADSPVAAPPGHLSTCEAKRVPP